MTNKRWLWLILLVALGLRLSFALAQDPLAPYQAHGSDSSAYLGNGYSLMLGRDPYLLLGEWDRWLPRYHYDLRALIVGQSPEPLHTDFSLVPSPPLYFLIVGIPQAITGAGTLAERAAAVIAIRVLQALLSTATCYFAYALARRLSGRAAAGLLAAAVIAASPVFIVEAAQILTETLFIFLATGGMWLYTHSIVNRQDAKRDSGREFILLIGVGILFGSATLTRAVLLLFPIGLAIHLLLMYGWRKGLRQAALLLIVYALVVGSWTVYSVARWNRFVIAGGGLPAFLYLGATGWDSAAQVDERLAEQAPDGSYTGTATSSSYTGAATSVISSDPLGWIKRRVTELAEAYLQPHGTSFYAGESLRDLVFGTLRGDRSFASVVQGDYFWQKLALYGLHYTALIGGLIGMWLYRRRWQVALPMIGLILYLTLVHLALLALPRYLFPNEVFWWVFAAAALVRLIDWRFRSRAAKH